MNASTTTSPALLPSPFAIFRNRDFSWMWIGQLVSTMGSALTSLASSILVYRMTDSALSVSLMLMATAAPSLLVGLFAGVFVDRFDRKKIMVIADVIRAALVILIPILVPINIAWLYVIVMLTSAIGQFFDPAHESVLPEVASEEELAAANSMMAISSFGSTAIGFAASGLIASRANINLAFYLDAFSFLFSGICIMLVRVKPLQSTEKATLTVIACNLQAGMRFLIGTPILRSLFIVMIPVLVGFGLSNSLLLPFAERALHATEFEYGLQEGITSLGFVAGSLLMAGLFDRMREGAWLAIGFLGMAIAGIAYSFSSTVPVAIVIVALSGFMNAPSSIARRVVVQRNTPREMRGRVNSAFFVSRDILYLVGMALAGLADIVNVRLIYLFSALLVLFSGGWVLVLPGLRQEMAEWRRALQLLRSASRAGAPSGRIVTTADMEALTGQISILSHLSKQERDSLLSTSEILEALAGIAIIRRGEQSDAMFFILSGQAVAGIETEQGNYRSLSTMTSGDFFGEIAALTGVARTADVVAEQPMKLLRVPAATLRNLMTNPFVSKLFLSKMTERLNRTSLTELPRFGGLDQQSLRELRNPEEVSSDVENLQFT